MDNEDSVLVKLVLAGDSQAYNKLAEKYTRPLAAIAYARVGEHEAARDITQEALIEAYRKLATLANSNKFAPWLYTILRNHAHSWIRRKKTEEKAVKLCLLQNKKEKQSQTPLDLIAQKEENKKLLQTLQNLAPADREIIMLRFYSNLGREAAASLLNINIQTADKRLQRAIARLREIISREI